MRKLSIFLPALALLLTSCHPPIPFGGTDTDTIDGVGDFHDFQFNPASRDIVLIRVNVTSGSMNPEAEVHRGSGTGPLVPDCHIGNGFGINLDFQCGPLEGTQYTIRVHDVGSDETGTYKLHVQRTRSAGGCTTVPFDPVPGQTRTGTIGQQAETDCFTFTAATGDIARVRMTVTSGNMNPEARVYNSAGNFAFNLNGVDGSKCVIGNGFGSVIDFTCGPLFAGQHTILVMDVGGDETGNYSVLLQKM